MPPKKKVKTNDKNEVVVQESEASSSRSRRIFNPTEIATIRGLMLSWFDSHRRTLPWREPGVSPYGIWVSEIMLQQTRVVTVIDYWRKWMKEFPTVEALAKASLERVNELWSGLGYYRRAEMLHRAAKMVVEQHGGVVPGTVEKLLDIPGIGRYTAGAIASIAFGQSVPALDGNAHRVLSRLAGVREANSVGAVEDLEEGGEEETGEQVDKQPTKGATGGPKRKGSRVSKSGGFGEWVWKFGADLVDEKRPGDFNQCLMEIGALLCTAKTTTCEQCPLNKHCQARQLVSNGTIPNIVDYIPAPKKKAPPSQQARAVCIVVRNLTKTASSDTSTQYLLLKRPAQGLLAHLWEFPSVDITASSTVTTGKIDHRNSTHRFFCQNNSNIHTPMKRE